MATESAEPKMIEAFIEDVATDAADSAVPESKFPRGIVYGPEHKNAGQEVNPKGPCIMSYDTKSMTVSDYYQFDEQFPLISLKSAFVNATEAFINEYARMVYMLLEASEQCRKRLRQGRALIDANATNNLIGRAHMRLEDAFQQVMKWDGIQPLMVMLPYAEVAVNGDGGSNDIDTDHSRPLVNGMVFMLSAG